MGSNLFGRGTIVLPPVDWTTATFPLPDPEHWIVTSAHGALVTYVPLAEDDSYGKALAVLGLRRPCQASPVLYSLREAGSWDDGDKWGSGLSWLAAVCDLSAMIGADIPDECGYRRSPIDTRTLDDIDADDDVVLADLALAYRAGRFTADDLTTAARILHRYLDACKRAGLDY